MVKRPVVRIDFGDESQLLAEIIRLDELRWSLLAERKVRKSNKVGDQLFELERHIPSLPDKGRRLLMRLADSPKEELRIKAAFHLVPLQLEIARNLLVDLAKNARNVHVKIEARTTLEELNAGRIDYNRIMNLPIDDRR